MREKGAASVAEEDAIKIGNNLVSSSDWALLRLVPSPPEFIEDRGEMREVAPIVLGKLVCASARGPLHFFSPMAHAST